MYSLGSNSYSALQHSNGFLLFSSISLMFEQTMFHVFQPPSCSGGL